MFCVKFLSTPNISVQQVPQPPISKSMSPYCVAPFLQRILQPPGQDQYTGKQTVSVPILVLHG